MLIKAIMVCTILLAVIGVFILSSSEMVTFLSEKFGLEEGLVVLGVVQVLAVAVLTWALMKSWFEHNELQTEFQNERDRLRFGFKLVCDQELADRALAKLALAFYEAAVVEGKVQTEFTQGYEDRAKLESARAVVWEAKKAYWDMHAVLETLGGIKVRKSFKDYLPPELRKGKKAA